MNKKGMIKIEEEHWALYLLAWLFCISVFLLPPIKIDPGLPAIFGTDILLPFIGIVTFKKMLQAKFPVDRRFTIYTGMFTICIILSILVNQRWAIISDWFEVYKILKFFIVVVYAALCLSHLNLEKILRIVFLGVVLFNVLHYFDVLNFNKYVEVYYGSDIQVSSFGLNSIGLPDTKRIIGTSANPNNNAILMMFFVVYFLKKNAGKMDSFYYFLAVFMVLVCQSRTGLFALILVLIIAVPAYNQSFKKLMISLSIYAIMYLLLLNLGNVYLNSLGDPSRIGNSFKIGRINMWIKLIDLWKLKPVFGYAPNKEYFYQRHWYSEGEYVLMLWRYGIVGLSVYLLWVSYPVIYLFKNIKTLSEDEFRLFSFTIVILAAAITNNPTADFSILMMFAMVIGLFFASRSIKLAVV